MHYIPITLPFLLMLFFLFALLVVVVELRIMRYAYENIGVGQRHMFALLFFSFLGSYVNIPIAHLPSEPVVSNQVISYFGMDYVVPLVEQWPGTVLAINIGGAVIPILLSIYLVFKNKLFVKSVLGVALVTVAVHSMAHPVPGVGIAEPVFVPPLVTVIVAVAISRRHAPALAYVAGSLGTLIGADLLNLGEVQGLGAPVASIGGAGKFDGIFLTGLIAVLLASVLTRRRAATRVAEAL
jgi:uncharacterized membrane protein